jgi:hypothetical protein
VHYSGFDTDLSTPASVDDQTSTNDDSVIGPVIEKCSFQRNTICLPPDIAFQVHLFSQMNTHRGNDLNMFNEVIQCVKVRKLGHRQGGYVNAVEDYWPQLGRSLMLAHPCLSWLSSIKALKLVKAVAGLEKVILVSASNLQT